MDGGASIHRQNLSDSILVFSQHLQFFAKDRQQTPMELFARQVQSLRARMPEKKLSAEVDTLEDALLVTSAGIDIVQCEKFSCEKLAATVGALRGTRPGILILAAGGITGENAAEYAATGVDVLVTTWPYFGKPSDIKVVMEPDGDC